MNTGRYIGKGGIMSRQIKAENICVLPGSPFPLGASVCGEGINFAAEVSGEAGLKLLIYRDEENGGDIELEFPKEQRIGDVCYMCVKGLDARTEYNYIYDGRIIHDSRAGRIIGREKWGAEGERSIRCGLVYGRFDWQDDIKPDISLNDTVIYRMHVRGFTKHSSSKVKGKGTFRGIIEKIPYLRELGVTYAELLPAYEFDEVNVSDSPAGFPFRENDMQGRAQLNYWGYKAGFYFAPKESYAKKDAATELRELVRELHKAGIELGMEFYFVPGTGAQYIADCLKYWVVNYHIDGFHINTEIAPSELIASEPLLAKTKLFGADWCVHGNVRHKHIASWNSGFMQDIRRFLKGDEGMAERFLYRFTDNPANIGVVNFLADHTGFTVSDMVSYERRHNEANGENNSDGEACNYSWNCGAEGHTRKKKILELRDRQIRNAWIMLLCSQGVPMLMAGDEFGRTQQGNNNPYCQDNEISWLDWRLLKTNADMYSFVRMLIGFRREHSILHMPDRLRQMDSLSCGYPDVSFHGSRAWYPETENYSRQAGVLFCEKYGDGTDGFIYVVFNMHWEEQKLAMPALEDGLLWKLFAGTGRNCVDIEENGKKCRVQGRSACIFVAVHSR